MRPSSQSDSPSSQPTPRETGDGAASGNQPGKQANQASLEAIWQNFGSQLRRRARTRLRQYGLSGQTESMDICNEVMVDLAKREEAASFTADDVLSYILRAIDNEVVDTFRTLARHCRDFRRNEGTPVDEIRLRGQESSPSQIALRREVADRVRSILGDSDALAIDMMLKNHDWNEIGRRLGVKPDTARMRVRRALDRAREEIGLRDFHDE
ncbi:sigma-70 family RNA polymerase sigma factor [Roseiconus nitratireducens]|uniref:Sigma-70 family RNA polymerase sigma factor n=1 Tax=Roseiconus nitratireducens TaxID=2605748 RepID=A0A5M6CYU1_9BACT|nr:sigma-70 family RNA polymerase sigma factor [Roseiconus nitratireducens]KAA5540046.1 sigma-70 family RNA polymerase sigma factor [Roseiconus nitratireducens]